MQFHRVTGFAYEGRPHYACTLKEAHDKAKEAGSELLRGEARIELIEIDTDRHTLASVLSGWGCTEKVLRTWKLTPRRGLTETNNGE